METILGLILQVLILACQIAVCVLGYVLVTRGTSPQQKTSEPEVAATALSEEERRMQEQMQKMMAGMNNILGYDGQPQGGRK